MAIGAATTTVAVGNASTDEDEGPRRKKIFQDIYNAVMEFDDAECPVLVAKALEDGEVALEILDEGLIPPMGEIGDLFTSGELFVPEMLMAVGRYFTGPRSITTQIWLNSYWQMVPKWMPEMLMVGHPFKPQGSRTNRI